ncbi:hypothetical protein KKD72_01035 [Patescibacteria group bacterium]|nr:hypothetical protein [Patescibacteria group bacterium]
MDYKKYRVRSPVKTFRDLEVYQITTSLSAELFNLKVPSKYRRNKEVVGEMNNLKEASKMVPRLIVESYSDKFSDLDLAGQKLEKAAAIVNVLIAKIDFINAIVDDIDFRGILSEVLNKYQRNKLRIINLKRSWNRVWGRK